MKKNKKEENIVVSEKHVGLRLTLFVIAALIAVLAFSYGVSQLLHRDEGYYDIEIPKNSEFSMYSVGFSVSYYFEGESAEIRSNTKKLEDLTATHLLRAYKLLDNDEEYDGYSNIATLCSNIGEEISVGKELYYILADAYERTTSGGVYNMFAGSLYDEWQSILTLEEESIPDFDPSNNENSARRIEELAEMTSRLEYFGLEFTSEEKYTVRFTVSDEYLAFLRENEYSERILDLNILADAYKLELVASAFEKAGFKNGYLYTDSGCALSLSEHTGSEYVLYGYGGELAPKELAYVSVTEGSAASMLYSFPLYDGELMYYEINGIHRSPNFDPRTGANDPSTASSLAVSDSLLDTCVANLRVFCGEDAELVASEYDGMKIAYTEYDAPQTVHASSDGFAAAEE